MNRAFHGFLASIVLVLLCWPTSAQEPRVIEPTSDTEKLQGTWLADLEPGLQGRLVLRKSNLVYAHIRNDRETVIWDGHFAVNEQAEPKQMDWTPLRRGNQNPMTNLAIYHLSCDVLLVIGSTDAPRPTAFYSGGGNDRPKTIIFRRSSEVTENAVERDNITKQCIPL